jgi:hypothetical protein
MEKIGVSWRSVGSKARDAEITPNYPIDHLPLR